jgi:hypothetical protein
VTSTTSKWGFTKLDWAFVAAKSALLIYAAALLMVACASPEPPQQPAAKNRVPTITQTETPPVQAPAAEEAKKEEPPYYGSTYWDEPLTSAYYYPKDGDKDFAGTHLKFSHRDDDLWLCGDQRKSFTPGNRYKLRVTFEPNQPCVTNWKIE